MAGKKVYVGAMIEDLQSKLDAVMTTLTAQTIALGNINTTVAQGAITINVKAGITKSFTSVNTAFDSGQGAPEVYVYTGISFRSFANGTVKVKGKCSSTISGYTTGIGVSVDGGAATSLIVTTQTAEKEYEANLDIKAGSTYKFYVMKLTTYKTILSANGIKIQYDMVDIVNEGGVVFI